jgi:hypothetical protein
LRKRYVKAGIQADQIVEKAVPGTSEKMLICTLKGRSEEVLVVNPSLTCPKEEDAANVAWRRSLCCPYALNP